MPTFTPMAIASAPTPPEVARRLAQFLRREGDRILADWEAALRTRPRTAKLDRAALLDDIPRILDSVAEAARGEETDTERPAVAHALHRLDQGFDLYLVVEEYGTLRQVLLSRWESSEEAREGAVGLPLLHEVLDGAIAAAVERYTETRQRTLVALDRISSAALAPGELTEFLRRMIDTLQALNPVIDGVAVLLLEEDGRLRVRATAGLEEEQQQGFSLEPGEGFSGTVAATRAPLEIHDVARHPLVRSAVLRDAGFRTLFGVPMVQDDRLVGVAHMGSRTAHAFSDEDKVLFRAMVERAAAGIVKRKLREALRRQTEALEKERQRLVTILELLPVGVEVADASGRVVQTNQAFRSLWGIGSDGPLEPGDSSLQPAREVGSGRLLPPGDWGIHKALASGRPVGSEELEIRTAEGRRLVILHAAAPVRHEGGGVVGAVATSVDITERRRIEAGWAFLAEVGAALGSSEELTSTLERVAELAVPRIADALGIYLDAGGGQRAVVRGADPEKEALARRIFERFRGGPRADAVRQGAPLWREQVEEADLLRWADDEEHLALLRRIDPRSLLVAPLEHRGRTFGTVGLYMSESGRRFGAAEVGLVAELAARLAVAIENAQLLEDTREAVRARDEMWAVASHELRNPLASLRLQLKMAEREIRRDDQAPAGDLLPRLRSAEQQLDRLIRLTSELLDTTRARAGQLDLRAVPTDLAEVVREVAEVHAYEALVAAAPIEVEVEPGLVGCWDRGRIEQVVTNLLTNAIKYGPDAPIAVRARREGDEAVLEVEDRGMGIPAEDLERIFTPFERTRASRRKKGVGLGLYISRRIVEAHGGTIAASSRVDEGSTFVVRLPFRPGSCPGDGVDPPG